jgi:intracellular sulfur oxidation DsrE/DsrF family protein
MRVLLKLFAGAAILISALSPGFAADAKTHSVSIQVDQNDPALMNLVLNNVTNIMETYKSKGQDVQIELVAYGPGLHMRRDDTSPVKDRLKQIAELSFPSQITFSACNNTKEGMEKREGHQIAIVSQARLVPSGAVRLMELQEDGWSYLKP